MGKGTQQGRTLKRKTILKRIRKLGFRKRMQSVGGKNVLKNRRAKKRSSLSVSDELGTKTGINKRIARRR